MTETWRPKDWKTIPLWLRLCDGTPITSTHEAFEMGADAMLAAIWKLAKESPTGTFVFSTHIISSIPDTIYQAEETNDS